MQIQFNFQGVDSSPWVEQFITKKGNKLSRYLSPSALVDFHIKLENQMYLTTMTFHHLHKAYAFTNSGLNLFESFSGAIDKACRVLSEEKRMVKDRISKRSSLIRGIA